MLIVDLADVNKFNVGLRVGIFFDDNGVWFIDDLLVDKIGPKVVSFSVSELINAFGIFDAESCLIALLFVSLLLTSYDVLVSINVEVDVVSGVFINISLSACSMGRGKIISLPTTALDVGEGSVVATTELIEEFCSLNRGSY